MDKKVAGGTIVALIAAVAGGGWALSLDFSQTSTVIGDTTTSGDTTVSGDTNIITQWRDGLIEEGVMIATCLQDIIPDTHTQACAEWEAGR